MTKKKEGFFEEQEKFFLEKQMEIEKQLLWGPIIGPNKELTEEKIMQTINDIMGSIPKNKPMVILMGCLDQGSALQSSEGFNLCNNPNCKNCRSLEDALKEQCK
jgi:hypothetical protein